MLGVDRTVAELVDSVHIDHFSEILVIPNLDLLDLVRCTESVEEVEERDSSLNGSKVCYCTEVHDFLLVGFCKHSESCLTAGIYVGVISEDVKSM